MSWSNHDALHRHACHAYEDFRELRKRSSGDGELWHSLSHHLRHTVFRSGHEVDKPRRRQVRRSHVTHNHR
jgi:hypothetical protein